MARRVMIIAGEASGDLHGSGVVRELKRLSPSVEVYGVGGERMKQEGMELIYHINELGFMGFLEVLRHLPFVKAMEHTLEQIVKFKKPDVLVLIDYPGFNLRFAQSAKRYGVKIAYYISPQVWAWHRSRVKHIGQRVDKLLVILPFEVDFYRNFGVETEFVGHPLLEVLEPRLPLKDFAAQNRLDTDRKILALLPGSRRQEIDDIFGRMLGAARIIANEIDAQIVVGVAPTLDVSYFSTMYNLEGVSLVKGSTYDLMAHAHFAFVTSGTATLETACFATPMFVLYRTSWPTFLIGKAVVRIRNIGLVNIVAGKQVVPEFIQYRVTASRLAREALKLLKDGERLSAMKAELGKVRSLLGTAGASRRVAECVLNMAQG